MIHINEVAEFFSVPRTLEECQDRFFGRIITMDIWFALFKLLAKEENNGKVG